MLVKVVLAFIN